MIDYRKIIKNRELRLKLISMLSWIPDKPYLKMVYRIKTGRKLNLERPVGFNEKLNWLKLHDIHPEYTQLVDKLQVRAYIARVLGEEYLFPLYGAWESFDQIDFDALPNEFVLKCNHDSGSVKIIRDKSKMDHKAMRRFFEGRLKRNPFYDSREYPYKNVTPCIMAEQLMKDADNAAELKDYKFFCFGGKPQFLYLSEGLANHDTARINYLTLDWKKAPFTRADFAEFDVLPPKPATFEKMLEICEAVSKDMPFVRVDLYDVNGQIYFGEFTFFPGGGYTIMSPETWEKKLGDMIPLDI